jgi:DNA polymerase
MWRVAHPATVRFWYDLDNAVKLVLERPAAVVPVGRVSVDRQGSWVRIRLPSGRYLGYPSMKLDDDGLSFAGVSPLSRQWQKIRTYSGKLAENIVQASSADILMDAIARAEGVGFVPVLSVHDEIVTEVPKFDDRLNEKRLSQVLAIVPEWANGLPLAAKGFQADRYRK